MSPEHEHATPEQPPLVRDFVSMFPEAIALRALIDHLGDHAPDNEDEAA